MIKHFKYKYCTKAEKIKKDAGEVLPENRDTPEYFESIQYTSDLCEIYEFDMTDADNNVMTTKCIWPAEMGTAPNTSPAWIGLKMGFVTKENDMIIIHSLCDTGSKRTFISERMVSDLGIQSFNWTRKGYLF